MERGRRVGLFAAVAALVVIDPLAALAAFTTSTVNGASQFATASLAAPDPLTCAWTGANGISLSWTNNSTWGTGYDYERSDSAGSGYSVLGSTGAAASVTGTDSNPAPTTLRYYRVRAKFGTGWTGPYSSVHASNTCDGTITTLDTYGASSSPTGIAVDASGNVYVADLSTNTVYRTTQAGVTTTYAGNGTAGYSGDGGAATSASLNGPRGLAFDSAGNLYIADSVNNRVRKVTTGGVISTVAGTGTAGFTGDGGAATSAEISGPYDAVADPSGNLYISDFGNNRIRKVTSGGVISTVAGGGATAGCSYSGVGTGATLANLRRLDWDSTNSRLSIVENGHCVRLLTGTTLTPLTGSGSAGYTGDDGPAVSATLTNPTDLEFSSTGDAYIADQGNHAVRKILAP